jgi:hypothetical protein
MPQLEKDIESDVTSYAKKKGCIERKMNGTGYRGWPDRMFLYNGHVLFIEFKRLGEKPDNLQSHIHGILRSVSFDVTVVDNVSHGRKAIDVFVLNSSDF